MRLLFDENLPPRLCKLVGQYFDELRHVRDIGMNSTDDGAIWSFAKEEGFMIVTRDRDFFERAIVVGPPPKIVWLRVRNGSTRDYAQLLVSSRDLLQQFVEDPSAYLVLPPGLRI